MNTQQHYGLSASMAAVRLRRNTVRLNLFDTNTREASQLSAARGRLIAAAEQVQQRLTNTNEEYYGGPGHGEDDILDITYGGQRRGVVTRNHYGCLVLNAAHVLFIDVDVLNAVPKEANAANAFCDTEAKHWQHILDDLSVVLADEKDQSFRVYQTAAGYRILATAEEFQPRSRRTQRLMVGTGADAAFVKLCRIQNNFRARLTPKPWRCGSRRPPDVFSRSLRDGQHRFAEWLSQYDRASRSYGTCRYMGHIGVNRIHQHIVPLIEFHDSQTRALEDLPLA